MSTLPYQHRSKVLPVISTTPEPLPSGRRGLSPEVVAESQRTRLVDAMILLVTEVGYADVTIAAITSRARTAKRTFYAHFPDREACFLAAYDRGNDRVFEAIGEAVLPFTEPYDRVHAGVGAVLEVLSQNPETARVWLEASVAGPAGIQRRVNTLKQLAQLYTALHQGAPTQEPPPVEPLSTARALSVVGAIELPMSVTLRERGAEALPELLDDLSHSVFTLVYGRPPGYAPPAKR